MIGTGAVAGIGAGALTRLLETVQRLVWGGNGTDLLAAAEQATLAHHVLVLLAAGAVTGVGQILLRRLASGNGIDTTAAIWFHAGRLPALRTLGSAVLSVIIVGMGASLGREGAPKQVGAVFANFFADRTRLSDEQRRLLVACGSGRGNGGGLRRSAGRRPLLFGGDARRAGLALRNAGAGGFRGGHRGGVDHAARRADVSHSGVCEFGPGSGLGAVGRPAGRAVFRCAT